jgi:hypothetical protein
MLLSSTPGKAIYATHSKFASRHHILLLLQICGQTRRATHLAQVRVGVVAIHLAAVHQAVHLVAVHQAVQVVAASGAVHQAVQLLAVHLLAAVDHWVAGVVALVVVVQRPLEAVPAASLLLVVPDSVVLAVPAVPVVLLPG